MKKKIITAAVLALALALTGCGNGKGIPVEVTGLSEGDSYNVVKLFEVDGITVYRFRDNGHTVYFTNRTGEARHTEHRMRLCGKIVRHKYEDIQTLCNDGQSDND